LNQRLAKNLQNRKCFVLIFRWGGHTLDTLNVTPTIINHQSKMLFEILHTSISLSLKCICSSNDWLLTEISSYFCCSS
jgi:predicted Abi (CAAX) family protease